MTVEDMKKAVEQLKADGNSDEAIMGGFYKMFQEEQITLDELEGIVNLMGWHFSEKFKNMSPEDQKTKGVEKTEETDATEEEIEDAKEVDSDEADEDDEDEADDSDDEESDEEKRANKLFGLDK